VWWSHELRFSCGSCATDLSGSVRQKGTGWVKWLFSRAQCATSSVCGFGELGEMVLRTGRQREGLVVGEAARVKNVFIRRRRHRETCSPEVLVRSRRYMPGCSGLRSIGSDVNGTHTYVDSVRCGPRLEWRVRNARSRSPGRGGSEAATRPRRQRPESAAGWRLGARKTRTGLPSSRNRTDVDRPRNGASVSDVACRRINGTWPFQFADEFLTVI